MANVLFQNNPNRKNSSNSILDIVSQARSLGPSGTVFNQLYASNPRFKEFANSMQGKTPEQAFRDHGLDFNQFKNFKW